MTARARVFCLFVFIKNGRKIWSVSEKSLSLQRKRIKVMDNQRKIQLNHYKDGTASVLRKVVIYQDLRFYQRSEVLYQLTVLFCERYLPKYGDRTVDQMVQAARSISANIAEGSSDGQTSMEVELKLLGIARGSNQELLGDYQNYLKRKGMNEWFGQHPRFDQLHAFCRKHSRYEEYQDLLPKLCDEEMANMAICLCHQVDKAMTSYIEKKDREFTTEGGIRERMTAARLDQRATQKEIIAQQEQRITALTQQLNAALQEIERLRKMMDERQWPGGTGAAG